MATALDPDRPTPDVAELWTTVQQQQTALTEQQTTV